MKRCFALSLCAVALTAFTLSDARADDIELDLQYGSGSWELYAEVISGGTVDGSIGISAVRALIDGIDFGTGGDAVTIAGGIGAINPVDDGGGNMRPPVLDLGGGVIEVLYGQDLANGPVVGGVGVGGPTLIASGTYSGADVAFGMDGALASQGLFLTSTAVGNNAVDPDAMSLIVTPDTGGDQLVGDFDNSDLVSQGDLDIVLLNWGTANFPGEEGNLSTGGPFDGLVSQNELDDVLLNWGNAAGGLAASSVPEPAGLALCGMALCGLATARRRG